MSLVITRETSLIIITITTAITADTMIIIITIEINNKMMESCLAEILIISQCFLILKEKAKLRAILLPQLLLFQEMNLINNKLQLLILPLLNLVHLK